MLALPINDALPSLRDALAAGNRAALIAPPGAGKTTGVPPALLDEGWLGEGRIIMLEPRRLAARAAATRMAEGFSEPIGQTVGLRARMMTAVSPKTRIEVVTEGVFTRLILDDPELTAVGAVIFDEFHERSLDADFGLALAIDAQEGLRPDLRLLVMSATLDGARIANKLTTADAPCPVITSEGRSYPVETRYFGRDTNMPLERAITAATVRAIAETDGAVLIFLPGAREIRRAADALGERLSGQPVDVQPLYGALARTQQDQALALASPGRRKVVLATAIAETSLTIEGVTAVIDSGLARVPRYDVGARLTRLETERVSRAAADQRRGRAGRLGPGVCYRLWAEPETMSLPAFAAPEIKSSDLTGLLLDCAAWGVTEPDQLTWLDPPPPAAVRAARDDLRALDALDASGRLTPFGDALRALPLAPHLAAMVVRAAGFGRDHASRSARLAALIAEPGLGGRMADIDARLARFATDRSERAVGMRKLADRWAREAGKAAPTGTPADGGDLGSGALLLLAYPDRLAAARGGGRFLLASGGQASLPEDDPLAAARFLVVADLQGAARRARITTAAEIVPEDVEAVCRDRIETRDEVVFDPATLSLKARRRRVLGAIALSETAAARAHPNEAARALADGIAAVGLDVLSWTKAQRQLRHRVAFVRRTDPETWPDLSDDALAASIADWLGPFLAGKTAVREITADDLAQALNRLVGWDNRRRLDVQAPTHWQAPTGHNHPIDYDSEHAPSVALRVQELFGLTKHPAIADGRLPLTLVLLSPAHRPIQVTSDLPGFWVGSWADVRADLRGRYPKHVWPEDPATVAPTTRAKVRGN
jgi:ATP-dependent helicase HrpB